jgi:hypothetical protein
LALVDGNPLQGGHLLVDQVVMSTHPPVRRDQRDTQLIEANLATGTPSNTLNASPA